MGDSHGVGRRGFGTLLRDLVEESTALARGEVRLATLELSRAATAIGRGSALVALGTVLVLLGVLALVVGLILLIGDQWLPANRYWLGALIVVAGTCLVALIFARRGLERLALARLGQTDIATSLKENATWVKQQLTSGETSK